MKKKGSQKQKLKLDQVISCFQKGSLGTRTMISENIQSERQDCIWETKNEGLKSSRSMIKLISNIVLENH